MKSLLTVLFSVMLFSAFSQVDLKGLKSLVPLESSIARKMIAFVDNEEATHSASTAEIAPADLIALASIADVRSIKLVRANFFDKSFGEDLLNRPTTLIAVITGKGITFFMPTKVCPPPDGSVCLE